MPGMVYRWRSGTRLSIDAQKAGEEIEHLRKRANGQLTPAQIVDAARPKRSVLHDAFEWDDTAAAELYREDQARYLVGCIVVTVKPKEKERQVRAFVNVTTKNGHGYTALHHAMSDVDLRRQVIAQALDELRAWRERYAAYSELAEFHAAIDAAGKKGTG